MTPHRSATRRGEPRNIRLEGARFEPPADDARWRRAADAQRRRYWEEVGEIAVAVKRREAGRGVGVEGSPLTPVRRRWGGPPLVPHSPDSRTQRLLAARTTASGATLYWRADGRRSWATILGYHAYRRGPRALPVRNTIGISPAGLEKVAGRARAWWRSTAPRVAIPEGARKGPGGGYIVGRVHYLAKGQRPDPRSRYIQVQGGQP